LDSCPVDRQTHFAAESIDFTHELPLGGASYCWIARHLRDAVSAHGQQNDRMSHPRRSKSCLTPCVPTANDDYFICRVHLLFTAAIIVSGFSLCVAQLGTRPTPVKCGSLTVQETALSTFHFT
jgi:hypothetical protein